MQTSLSENIKLVSLVTIFLLYASYHDISLLSNLRCQHDIIILLCYYVYYVM